MKGFFRSKYFRYYLCYAIGMVSGSIDFVVRAALWHWVSVLGGLIIFAIVILSPTDD